MSLKRKIKSATSLNELASALRSAANALNEDINDIIKESAIELSFNLIYSTPVDTSTATSNWQVGLLVPELFARTAYFYGDEGSTSAMSKGAAYAAARSAITARKPHARIYISNNVDYIVELNQGKSPQQPTAGWIDTAVDKTRLDLIIKVRRYIYG